MIDRALALAAALSLLANLSLAAAAPSRASAGPGDTEMARDITLTLGEQRVLPSEEVASYSEGAPGVVDIRLTPDGGSFVLVGKRVGRTSLLLMLRAGGQVQYRIEVVDAFSQSAGPRETSVEARDNIRLDFYFVQISRETGARVGVSWPASYGAHTLSAKIDLLGGAFTEATAAVTEQALPRLDLAQSAGWAKITRQASVITSNGTDASISGGGEMNIPVQTALGVGIRQIEYGSQVRVLPRYDRKSGRIELTLHAEVSDLASDRGSGVPGRTTSALDSVVNLELGESLVIAGLTANTESGAKDGLPLLSQIPIIGALFGSHSGRTESSESLVFIVPSVVDAVSADARAQLRRALEIAADYSGDFADSKLRDRQPGIADKPAGARPKERKP